MLLNACYRWYTNRHCISVFEIVDISFEKAKTNPDYYLYYKAIYDYHKTIEFNSL